MLSAIGTYNYKLAKFLVPILQPLTSNQYTVKDSFSFVNEISLLPNHSYFMASLDVTSLLTTLLFDEYVDLCFDQLIVNHDIIEHNGCKFDKSIFRTFLSFAVKDNHCVLDERLCDQIDGVAMGSPLCQSMANFFMCALERKFHDDCPSRLKPKRLSSLFKYKDFFPSLVCSNFIYKYSSSGSNATCYAKTSRNLKIRCYEHLGPNESGENRASPPSSSSILDHIKQSGHNGTLEDFSIISKSENSFDLSFHESLLIQRCRTTLNS